MSQISNNENNPNQNAIETHHNKDRLEKSKLLNSAIAYIQKNYAQENNGHIIGSDD